LIVAAGELFKAGEVITRRCRWFEELKIRSDDEWRKGKESNAPTKTLRFETAPPRITVAP
jgi:hypothetical protein